MNQQLVHVYLIIYDHCEERTPYDLYMCKTTTDLDDSLNIYILMSSNRVYFLYFP